MNYLIKLCISIITLPACLQRINTDLSDQKHKNEKLTHQVIRLETILEMHLAKHISKK